MKISRNVLTMVSIAVVTGLAGCGGKKDTNAMPQVVWVVAGSPSVNQEQFGKELADWFSPFKDEKACPTVRFYPQVEILRIDATPSLREQLVVIDPKTLVRGNQNFVQKIFGAKPKFDKLIELASSSLRETKISETLAQPTGQVSQTALWTLLSKKAGLVVGRDGSKKDGETLLAQLTTVNSDNAKVFAYSGDKPDSFREAVAKHLCESASSKPQTMAPIILVNVNRALQTPTPPPPPPPPPPSSKCEVGQVGRPPNCSTPPNKCATGQVGTPPNCSTPPQPGKCETGQVGTPPHCSTPPPSKCATGQVGAPPNCSTPSPSRCATGQVGTPPNCSPSPQPGKCEAGQVGRPPNCSTPPDDCLPGMVGCDSIKQNRKLINPVNR